MLDDLLSFPTFNYGLLKSVFLEFYLWEVITLVHDSSDNRLWVLNKRIIWWNKANPFVNILGLKSVNTERHLMMYLWIRGLDLKWFISKSNARSQRRRYISPIFYSFYCRKNRKNIWIISLYWLVSFLLFQFMIIIVDKHETWLMIHDKDWIVLIMSLSIHFICSYCRNVLTWLLLLDIWMV